MTIADHQRVDLREVLRTEDWRVFETTDPRLLADVLRRAALLAAAAHATTAAVVHPRIEQYSVSR